MITNSTKCIKWMLITILILGIHSTFAQTSFSVGDTVEFELACELNSSNNGVRVNGATGAYLDFVKDSNEIVICGINIEEAGEQTLEINYASSPPDTVKAGALLIYQDDVFLDSVDLFGTGSFQTYGFASVEVTLAAVTDGEISFLTNTSRNFLGNLDFFILGASDSMATSIETPDAIKQNPISIYPTHASDMLQVDLLTHHKADFVITDMLGQSVMTGQILHGQQSVDISILPRGVYMFQAVLAQKVASARFFVEK